MVDLVAYQSLPVLIIVFIRRAIGRQSILIGRAFSARSGEEDPLVTNRGFCAA